MSYTRTYRERIAVHYSGTVSYNYPASQNGGSGTAHYSGTEYEDVNVSIEVDTEPFDNSVEHCNTNVNLLTGAVVATEAAQIVSIDKNSKKVAETIITGFFGYIRSEISQQIAELSQNIDAQLMHLKELAQSCLAKKKQMEGDFTRISSRYIKIFDDLNNELSNRIYELDKPTFVFKKELDNQSIRTITIQGSTVIEGPVYAHKLEIQQGDSEIHGAVFTQLELYVNSEAKGNVTFKKSVGSAKLRL